MKVEAWEDSVLVLTSLRTYPGPQIAPWSPPEGLPYLGHLTSIIQATGHDQTAGHLSSRSLGIHHPDCLTADTAGLDQA